jgi:site-specific recombinase XerD
VIPKAKAILTKFERQGDYIFIRDGKRITSIRIATILRKYARYQGTCLKSSHKLRKTFASNLNSAGVPLDCIREMLGHSSLQTTLGYIYNPLSEQQTYDLISSAL